MTRNQIRLRAAAAARRRQRQALSTPMGQRFKLARKNAGLNQREAAKASGVSCSFISQIETGWSQEASLVLCLQLATAYGVSLDWLATGRGTPQGTGGER